jgi:hypothetical protein
MRQTAAEAIWKRSTDPRRRFAVRIPVTLRSGPSAIVTVCPAFRNGNVRIKSPDATAASTAVSSSSSTGTGIFPRPTMRTTPGTTSTGKRRPASSRQKTYPGKKREVDVLKAIGPLPPAAKQRQKRAVAACISRADATAFSARDVTCSAYQGKPVIRPMYVL